MVHSAGTRQSWSRTVTAGAGARPGPGRVSEEKVVAAGAGACQLCWRRRRGHSGDSQLQQIL